MTYVGHAGATFEFTHLTSGEARTFYPVLWATAQQALPGLSEEEVATVVSLAADTCRNCYEDNSRCRCRNAQPLSESGAPASATTGGTPT